MSLDLCSALPYCDVIFALTNSPKISDKTLLTLAELKRDHYAFKIGILGEIHTWKINVISTHTYET